MKFVGSYRVFVGVPLAIMRQPPQSSGDQLTDPPRGEEGLINHPLIPSRGRDRSHCLILEVLNPRTLASSLLRATSHVVPEGVPTIRRAIWLDTDDGSRRSSFVPSLALHKIGKSQVRTKRKGQPKQGRQVPLEKFLRIRRPTAARKKLFSKNFKLAIYPLHGLYRLCHEFWDRPRLVILPGKVMEVTGPLLLFWSWYPKGILNWLTLVPVRNVSPARLLADKEKVILPILYFRLFLNGRYEARPIIEAVPPQVPSLLGSFLD
ncbi:LOW QUALITY PROTEIN: hypothetical protein Cgig2_028738 [Carnegiea gigantea]|uniref:Uncharacterized protein n=1 Tax=Carnegiea gigantea TaxID=171969 RepID=A0A9Q1GS05_9CARY|nr:LOW QUALITY PROTEIN: hypothetical protein Cgig2_028738 [Carnegiea gigantea]